VLAGVLAAFVAGRTSDQSLADFLNTQVFADSSLEQPNLTRRTPPVSTPSSSDTSARCPWNERLSSTADNTAGDLDHVEWCSRLLTEARPHTLSRTPLSLDQIGIWRIDSESG
jgi:hypothetical protein